MSKITLLGLVALLAALAVADSHALPPAGGWRSWLQQHRQLIARAKSLQPPSEQTVCADESQPVSWARLWQELRATQQLKLVLPASCLSVVLTTSELISPRLRGQLFDAVLAPGATLSILWPKLRWLAAIAVLQWALHIVSSILFAQARWTTAMATRTRLMEALLAQEPAFFDGMQPGELNSRLLSEPDRLESLANRGLDRGLTSVLSVGGSFALMLLLEWRLALLAVVLRAPLIGKLAEAAGRSVGLLGLLQQQALNEANAIASEALAQPLAVTAHAARRTVHSEYASRVEAYMQVIRATLVSETVLRFTRLGIDSLTSWLLLAFGLLGVLRGTITIGALTAFYALADRFADGCQKLQDLMHDVYVMRPSCARYFELLDRRPGLEWCGGTRPERCDGAFVLRNVTKTFPGRRDSALRNLDLEIRPGEIIALVGPSGAGKSTVVKLLNRMCIRARARPLA